MKKRNNGRVVNFFAILSIIVSISGILITLPFELSNAAKYYALSVVVISFTIGVFSTYITKFIQKFVKSRRVFLSHAYETNKIAIEIASDLRHAGAKVWLDLEQIKPGDKVASIIENAMLESDTMVALLTKNLSDNFNKEVNIARQNGIRVIPVLLEKTEIPAELEDLAYIDMESDKVDGMRKLIEAST